jgi:hypothetical protein
VAAPRYPLATASFSFAKAHALSAGDLAIAPIAGVAAVVEALAVGRHAGWLIACFLTAVASHFGVTLAIRVRAIFLSVSVLTYTANRMDSAVASKHVRTDCSQYLTLSIPSKHALPDSLPLPLLPPFNLFMYLHFWPMRASLMQSGSSQSDCPSPSLSLPSKQQRPPWSVSDLHAP